ncbi:unnamed protein product [Adineta ricciae]|uniref:Uncharacterized protein n=1 Tax=Adineta ricciae TaxID=249248 RepID=A0A814PWH0_ADIRI|nr:unnamed protein product [Adineta ricciae]
MMVIFSKTKFIIKQLKDDKLSVAEVFCLSIDMDCIESSYLGQQIRCWIGSDHSTKSDRIPGNGIALESD